MLQLAALDIVQFIAIEVRHHGRRCDAQRLLAIDIPCDNVVCVQQRLRERGREEERESESRQLEMLGMLDKNYGQQLRLPVIIICGPKAIAKPLAVEIKFPICHA